MQKLLDSELTLPVLKHTKDRLEPLLVYQALVKSDLLLVVLAEQWASLMTKNNAEGKPPAHIAILNLF